MKRPAQVRVLGEMSNETRLTYANCVWVFAGTVSTRLPALAVLPPARPGAVVRIRKCLADASTVEVVAQAGEHIEWGRHRNFYDNECRYVGVVGGWVIAS